MMGQVGLPVEGCSVLSTGLAKYGTGMKGCGGWRRRRLFGTVKMSNPFDMVHGSTKKKNWCARASMNSSFFAAPPPPPPSVPLNDRGQQECVQCACTKRPGLSVAHEKTLVAVHLTPNCAYTATPKATGHYHTQQSLQSSRDTSV